jgi:hypothetical protein
MRWIFQDLTNILVWIAFCHVGLCKHLYVTKKCSDQSYLGLSFSAALSRSLMMADQRSFPRVLIA